MSIIEKNIVKILLNYGYYPTYIGMAGDRDQTWSRFRLVGLCQWCCGHGRALMLMRGQQAGSGAGQEINSLALHGGNLILGNKSQI